MLDRVKAEPKRVREFSLRHAQPSPNGLYINLLGHMRLESLLLSGKKSLNVVQAIHHLLELRFHACAGFLVSIGHQESSRRQNDKMKHPPPKSDFCLTLLVISITM